MSILINIASEFTGKKAFREADTAIGKLNKTVKGLGLGFAVSAAAATSFAKASINAFIQDEAAASKLSLAVKNLGMEFANPYIANYISDMEKMTKVADDELRPAFQALLQQTGSLSASQSILSTAIEASRGSGYSLAQVSNDLAQAYIGNTKGLKKYYLGLSNASLQAKSFTEIQKIMNDQFTGSSAAYLNTYSGQVGVLSLAWGNFQEKVGGTLLTLASFGDGSEGAKLNLLASTLDTIGSAIELIGKGKETIAGLFNITGKGGLLSGFNPYRTPTSDKETKAENPMDKYAKQLAKIEADRKKQNAAVLKSQKALTAEQKKQAELKKAGSIFDLTQIQIIAALKGNISEEERKRLELQLALEQGNVSEAKALTYQLAIAQGLGVKIAQDLASLPAASNPFAAWKGYLDAIELQALRIAGLGGGVVTPSPSGNVPKMPIASPDMVLAQASADFNAANNTIKLIVEGGDEVTNLMRFKIQEAAQSGSTTNWSQTVGAWDR
jgi:hypothetical protein